MSKYSIDFLETDWANCGSDANFECVWGLDGLGIECIEGFVHCITSQHKASTVNICYTNQSEIETINVDGSGLRCPVFSDDSFQNIKYVSVLIPWNIPKELDLEVYLSFPPLSLEVGGASELYYSGSTEKDAKLVDSIRDIVATAVRYFGECHGDYGGDPTVSEEIAQRIAQGQPPNILPDKPIHPSTEEILATNYKWRDSEDPAEPAPWDEDDDRPVYIDVDDDDNPIIS